MINRNNRVMKIIYLSLETAFFNYPYAEVEVMPDRNHHSFKSKM